ncbi:carbon storage regulator [Pseudomonas sp. BN102]|uniref:carbon storage regulator n=1 Tax=Pseudomonas sp. BN102 TaxID=2567886 RepID=UPI0024556554|nr:carbon storage regulator [Pseudomonas sp. BN102]
MLILIRRIGESIRINDNVTVRVMAATGNKAVLGITAPKAIVVRDWESCPHQRI